MRYLDYEARTSPKLSVGTFHWYTMLCIEKKYSNNARKSLREILYTVTVSALD